MAEDTSKRSVFTGIQHSSTIAAKGYKAMPVQTGYESILAERTTSMFCTTAQQEGKVIALEDDLISVEYKDGTVKHVELGMRYGNSEGSVYSHVIVTDLKLGDKVKVGDPIGYNESFFVPTAHDGKQLSWRSGVLAYCAFVESNDVFEDSNSMSESFAREFDSEVVKVKDITIPFDSAVHNLVKVGDKVQYDDILCSIEQKIGEDTLFNEGTSDLLKDLSKSSPKAGVYGTITNIEVFYRGEKSEMDDSLKKLADSMDRRVKSKSQRTGGKITSAQVDGSLRIDGKPLQPNHCNIRVYVNSIDETGTADKFVVANQLKTTIARKHANSTTTEDGIPVDMFFGVLSVSNRIVDSSERIGIVSTINVGASKEFARIYREG